MASANVTEEALPQRQKKEAAPPKYQPNVVPLIDVLFLLLLFFLLNSQFRQAEGDIPGSLPSAGLGAAGGILKETVVTIRASGDDKMKVLYEISNSNVSINTAEELFQRLHTRMSGMASPDSPVVLEPMGDVRWKFVVEAYNQAYRAKFKNITFRYPT